MNPDVIQRLEKLAEMGDSAEPLIELAQHRMRAGQYVQALRLLQRSLTIENTPRARSLLGQLESRHKILCVRRKEYLKATRRLRENARQTWGSYELPRKNRKRAIILHFILTRIDCSRVYSGDEIDGVLQRAVKKFRLRVDHCHLRRYMQALGMLHRTDDGRTYWLRPHDHFVILTPEPSPERPLLYFRTSRCRESREALSWLEARRSKFEPLDVRELAPSPDAVLATWRRLEQPLDALLRQKIKAYRRHHFATLLEGEPEALIETLCEAPDVLRCPILDTGHGAAVGFDAATWKALIP